MQISFIRDYLLVCGPNVCVLEKFDPWGRLAGGYGGLSSRGGRGGALPAQHAALGVRHHRDVPPVGRPHAGDTSCNNDRIVNIQSQ